ncbi:MAG TPA: ester cyclase [Solirubrobacteraceae bacterium]|nr:ester cyclase [Solirubrobacteraceae bacterium]
MSSTQDPKAVVNRLINDVINARRPDLAHEVMHPELEVKRMGMQKSAQYLAALNGAGGDGLKDHGGPPSDPIEGFKTAFARILVSFPDMRNNLVGPQVVDGDLVISHITFSGTHQGDFLGCAPTGKFIEFDEVLFQRVEDGKVREVWAIADGLDLLEQLGVIPTPGE